MRWAQRWARLPVANSTEETGWVSPGCVTLAGSASTAGAAAEPLPAIPLHRLGRRRGYAEFTTVPAAFAHHLPSGYSDSELAPLLCAGIIGYRSLLRTELPPGGRLGLYGFGGSAHITAQVALAQGAEIHVMTRGARARKLALQLGAASAQDAADRPPVPLDAAILFAPVGDLVLPALEALDRGGILAIAGIHLTDIPDLNYQQHLFQERQIRSVTSNTRADARAFFDFAAQHHIEVTTPEYPLGQADRALGDLSAGRIAGAAVLLI